MTEIEQTNKENRKIQIIFEENDIKKYSAIYCPIYG